MEAVPTVQEQQQLADAGAFIEHTLWTVMPTGGKQDIGEVAEAIRRVGVQKYVMSTDFGQAHHPPAPEGMRMFISTLLQYGFSEDDIELMVKINPGKLLGLA